jgi:glyoxylase-like metal-dependent hydrolase (beta-lactamase superfamily II)
VLPQAPAHTDGDVAVFLSSANVLVTGDLFTQRSYPVIDESSGGSLRGMIEAVERLLPHGARGHGAYQRSGALQTPAVQFFFRRPIGSFTSHHWRGFASGRCV